MRLRCYLVIGNLQLVIGNRQLAKRWLVIGQTKVSAIFMDRVEFLDRVEYLDSLECLDRQEYLDWEPKNFPFYFFPTFEGRGGGKVRLGQFPSIQSFFLKASLSMYNSIFATFLYWYSSIGSVFSYYIYSNIRFLPHLAMHHSYVSRTVPVWLCHAVGRATCIPSRYLEVLCGKQTIPQWLLSPFFI